MTETTSLGYWILRQRKALDLTRAELASQVNCATETIKKIERDERRPSRQVAELLAKALAVPLDERERFLKIARGELPVDRLYLATRPVQPLASPLHNFPASLTPFVGRKKEIEAITRLIQEKTCRLLNIVGPGGIGKTRLTVAAASTLAHDHPDLFLDGVFFIPLAPVTDSTSLTSVTASSLRFVFQAHENELKDQLINYLRTKQILLILDTFEHLIDEAGLELVVDLLSAVSGLKIIITSRAQLNVQGEQVFLLGGLETPDIRVVSSRQYQVEQANEYSSMQLFALCARRVRSNFKLTADNLVHITRICQMVQGMPLAIELSAAWIPALAPEKIATEVGKSLDILQINSRGLTERQRSIRSVFATSWRLVSAEEQESIQRLSVYTGGFTGETADTSQHVSISTILSLVNKSWVQPEEKGRFQMHELLRQYSYEQLQLNPNLQLDAHHLHSAYFCHFLKERESGWLGARQLDIVNEINDESQNIAAAWEWAIDHENIDLLVQAIDSLCNFYDWTGRLSEGYTLCLNAIRKMIEITAQEGAQTPDALELQIRAMVWQGLFSDDFGFASRTYQEAQVLLDQLSGMGRDIRSVKAKILLTDGVNVIWSDSNRAWQLVHQSLLLYKTLGDEANEGEALSFLGTIAWVKGEFDQATQLTQNGLAIRKRLGNREGMADSLDVLGKILRARGQLSEAEKCNRESLALVEELGRPSYAAEMRTNLANTLIWEGKFEEAEAESRESLVGFDCLNIASPYTATLISKALLHQGKYAEALAYAQSSLEIGQKKSDPMSIGLAHYNLGDIALVENRLVEAQEQLHKSSAVMLANKQHILYGLPMADKVYVSLALNQADRATQYLCQCLEYAIKTRSFMPAIQALPAIALLASYQGDIEWSVEVYTLARTYPFIGNSQWFKDMAGKLLDAAATQLPKEVEKAVSSRGKSLDLWQVIEEWQSNKLNRPIATQSLSHRV